MARTHALIQSGRSTLMASAALAVVIAMPATALSASQLRLTIDPTSLGFASTAELQDLPLPWIGQERAQAAAQFGLQMNQPDYHLFVLGEVGSGRTSLMRQAMQTAAALRPVPPDLCYLHNFEAPERPRALRLPAGQGRVLRRAMAELAKALQTDIPRHLSSPDFRAQARAIEQMDAIFSRKLGCISGKAGAGGELTACHPMRRHRRLEGVSGETMGSTWLHGIENENRLHGRTR